MSVVNQKAYQGTVLAHTEGGVPNMILELDDVSEETLGELIYFFEKACAISGYMLGVNPFNQPGVESYKKNMSALLGKPGYESQKAELEAERKRLDDPRYIEKLAREDYNMVGKDEVPLFIVDEQKDKQ